MSNVSGASGVNGNGKSNGNSVQGRGKGKGSDVEGITAETIDPSTTRVTETHYEGEEKIEVDTYYLTNSPDEALRLHLYSQEKEVIGDPNFNPNHVTHIKHTEDVPRFDTPDNVAHVVIILIIALFVWLGVTPERAHGEECVYGQPFPLSCGETVDGALRGCDLLGGNVSSVWRTYRTYSIDNLPAGRKVTVRVQSPSFDPSARLFAKRSLDGNGVVNDDAEEETETGGTTDSLLVIPWTVKGGYRLDVVSADGKEGDTYRVTVECTEGVKPVVTPPPPPPPPPPPVNPPPGTCTPDPSVKGSVKGQLIVIGKVIATRRTADTAEVDIHPGDGTLWTVLCTRGKRTLGLCVGKVAGAIMTAQGEVKRVGMRMIIEP